MAETNPLNQSNPGTLILSSPTERMYHGGEQIQQPAAMAVSTPMDRGWPSKAVVRSTTPEAAWHSGGARHVAER